MQAQQNNGSDTTTLTKSPEDRQAATIPDKKEKKELQTLTDKERQVFLGMAYGINDTQAIQISGLTPRTFYRHKSRVTKLMQQFASEAEGKAHLVLKGSVIKASQVIVQGLDQPSYKYRYESASQILDRVLGKPKERIESLTQSQITVLGISATPQELEALTRPIMTAPLQSNDSTDTVNRVNGNSKLSTIQEDHASTTLPTPNDTDYGTQGLSALEDIPEHKNRSHAMAYNSPLNGDVVSIDKV